MIPKIAPSLQCSTWQSELAQAIREPEVLFAKLQLPESLLKAAKVSAKRFPLRVTHSFLARMEVGNVDDPLLRQVLPVGEELSDWGESDPVGDKNAMPSPGLLHKYHGRVLLVSTAACAIHCRYCFRQHFPYHLANPLGHQLPATLDYIKQHRDIHEVILSGGDPLSLTDERLTRIIAELNRISHLKTLRIHSRLPVVLPSRIASMCTWLQTCRLNVVMVLHINHPNELNDEFIEAMQVLRDQKITLLNQSVLLKGVNDNAHVLCELSYKLLDCGITPYYLHQLDRVSGAAHFEVPIEMGRQLIETMRQALPGYLVPRFVQEIPGQTAKSPL